MFVKHPASEAFVNLDRFLFITPVPSDDNEYDIFGSQDHVEMLGERESMLLAHCANYDEAIAWIREHVASPASVSYR